MLSIMTSKTTRSRVTNGKSLFLERVDGRSLTARRYRDLYQAFIADPRASARNWNRSGGRIWTAGAVVS